MREINELKQEVARIKGEVGCSCGCVIFLSVDRLNLNSSPDATFFQGSMMIESLQNRIRELESELQTFRQIGESTQQVRNKRFHCLQCSENRHLPNCCFHCDLGGDGSTLHDAAQLLGPIHFGNFVSLQENETLRNMLKDKEDNAEVIAQMDQFESEIIVHFVLLC